MFRTMLLGGALLAAAGATGAQATTFDYDFQVVFMGNTIGSGAGHIFADDNGDGTFTVTGADGSVSSFLSDDDAITGATSRDFDDNWQPIPATIFSTGNPASYGFDQLRLMGNWAYDFFYVGDEEEGDTPFLLGTIGEGGAPATFHLSLAASAAPEAATWAMMLAGFGATGFAMRRRRASVTFA